MIQQCLCSIIFNAADYVSKHLAFQRACYVSSRPLITRATTCANRRFARGIRNTTLPVERDIKFGNFDITLVIFSPLSLPRRSQLVRRRLVLKDQDPKDKKQQS